MSDSKKKIQVQIGPTAKDLGTCWLHYN